MTRASSPSAAPISASSAKVTCVCLMLTRPRTSSRRSIAWATFWQRKKRPSAAFLHAASERQLLSQRKSETDHDDHQPDELRQAGNDAQRQKANDEPENRHQCRKGRGAAGAEPLDGLSEQIDRKHTGEHALHRDLQ